MGSGSRSDPELWALQYLQKGYPFKTAEDRRALATLGNLHRITDWEAIQKLRKHTLFYFESTRGVHPTSYDVLAIDVLGAVLLPRQKDDFNALLRQERLKAKTPSEAGFLAEFYLQLVNISRVVNYGVNEGVRVLSSVDDIPSLSVEQRERLAPLLQVAPPTVVETNPGVYTYTVYSWEREGSGAVDRRRIMLGPGGLVSYQVELLYQWLGAWDGIR